MTVTHSLQKNSLINLERPLLNYTASATAPTHKAICHIAWKRFTSKDSARNEKTLINQFNRISELSEENKAVVSKLLDAFLFQQEMKQKLAG